MLDRIKHIENQLLSEIESQMSHLDKVNAKELSEVVDTIHHLEEAMYYCSIIEAMEKTNEEKETSRHYYMEEDDHRHYVPYMEYAPYMMRDEDWRNKHLYTDRSGMSRRMYMEGKQTHSDNQQSMRELEHYIKDLGDDLTDMIKESTTEEKQVLSAKLQQLATKIK